MNAFCSLFSQILKFIPRGDFAELVTRHNAERHARGASCWQQFVSMMFCQLGRAHSLREIEQGLKSCEGKLSHLGIDAVSRSTLSYMNEHRPWQLYESVFHRMLQSFQSQLALSGSNKGRRFRFKNKLVSLDSTTIDLCLRMYDWAKFRKTKGAIKLHMLLDHDGYLPSFCVITDGKVGDVTVAKRLKFEAETIVVDDRGYNDYELFGRWTDDGVYFVTRLKDNAVYRTVKNLSVPEAKQGSVLKDQIIRFTGQGAKDKCPHEMRLVSFYDEEQDRTFQFLTNNLRLAAATIAEIYKARWAVELFFKALKQNLKIKTFVGTTSNAVKTQVWTALITMLMLRFMQLKSQWGWSLSNLVALLRMNLFTHRNLWAWLDNPLGVPPDPAAPQQAMLGF
ncbi:MAG: IS4 family transposase [Pseudomonas fluorescens]